MPKENDLFSLMGPWSACPCVSLCVPVCPCVVLAVSKGSARGAFYYGTINVDVISIYVRNLNALFTP